MGALATFLTGMPSVLEAEGLALTRNLEWARYTCIPVAEVKVDALSVVKAFEDRRNCFSHFVHLLYDVDIVLSSFPSISLVHTCRASNKVAYELARFWLRIDRELCLVGRNSTTNCIVLIME